MAAQKIKKGDKVVVLSGKDKGRTGEVTKVIPRDDKVIGYLTDLAALVAHARLVLAPDTGVAHLATAYGTPSVVLFGPVPARHWGPPAHRRQHRVLETGRHRVADGGGGEGSGSPALASTARRSTRWKRRYGSEVRLRRVDVNKPGYGRRRRGRGVSFFDTDGRPLRDPAEVARCRELVIPPAWQQVWICPHPAGHVQATGIDAAGRKQYLYHPQWRERRDAAKFDHMLEVADRLPTLRDRTGADLAGRGLTRERVLATVARLLDLGMFRVGSDQYATGDDPTFGVATLRPDHVRTGRGCVVFAFPAKGGIEQVRRITDPQLCGVLRTLRRRRDDAARGRQVPA